MQSPHPSRDAQFSRIYHIFCDRYSGHVSPQDTQVTGTAPPPRCAEGKSFQFIISQLELIKQMGFTAIYLSPFFESDSYHAYDGISTQIDPNLGTPEELHTIFRLCREYDLKLIMDFVPNHVSRKNPLSRYQEGQLTFFGDDNMARMHLVDSDRDALSGGGEALLAQLIDFLREFPFDGIRVDHVAGPDARFWPLMRERLSTLENGCPYLIGEIYCCGIASHAARALAGLQDQNLPEEQLRTQAPGPHFAQPVCEFYWELRDYWTTHPEACDVAATQFLMDLVGGHFDAAFDFMWHAAHTNPMASLNTPAEFDMRMHRAHEALLSHYGALRGGHQCQPIRFLDNHDLPRCASTLGYHQDLSTCQPGDVNLDPLFDEFEYLLPASMICVYYGTECGMTHPKGEEYVHHRDCLYRRTNYTVEMQSPLGQSVFRRFCEVMQQHKEQHAA